MEERTIRAGFTHAATLSVIALGALGSLALPLQPLMLGQLASEGRISLGQIGQAAMLEGLGMAIAASFAGFRLRPDHLRSIAFAAITVSALVNLLTGHLAGAPLMAIRFFGGISAGLMSWLWVGMLSRHAVPARLCAIFILLQSSILLGLSFLFSRVLFAWGGAAEGYAIIAGLNFASLSLVSLIPRKYEVDGSDFRPALPSARGLVGLLTVALNLGGVMALWVYLMPLAKQAGLSEIAANSAISFALAGQLAGGLGAGLLGSRLSGASTLMMGLCALIILTAILGITGSATVFTICITLFSFLWMFVGSFNMPFLIGIEKERRAAMQLPTAQLAGMAAGPATASLIVTLWGLPLLVAGCCAILLTALILAAGTVFVSSQQQREASHNRLAPSYET